MKALVVDDDPISLKLLATMLERNSFDVVPKESARDALDFLEKGEFVDIIVSDVMMPHMDGFTFVRRLSMDSRLNKIPVILCTALSDRQSLVKAIEAGIAGYVVKPVKEAILIPKVVKAVESYPGAVLVVDDEELLRNLLVTTLRRDRYKVLAAESGAAAVEILKNNKVALVVSDIAMPEMDGFKLLVHIKEIDISMPVILMSGRGKYSRDSAVSLGADDFIPKPFNNTEILTRVRALYK